MLLLGYGDHRTRQPSGAMVPSKKWLDKGLQLVYIGNKVVWSILDGPHALTTASGGPKTTPCNLGIATGFGSTSGSGTTDRQTGPLLRRAASGWRSVVLFINPNSAGPGSAARLYQGIGTGGYDYGESCYFNTSNALHFYQCVANGATPLRVSTTNVTYGVWQSYGVTFDLRILGVTPDMYKNGAVITPSVNSTPSFAYGTVAYKIEFGNRDDNTRSWDGLIGPILIFDGYLTAQEHFDLDRNPWQIFDEDESFLWLPFGAAGGTTVAPGSGHLTISGKQPTVSQTDHHTVSPGAGHLALSGKQPTVTQSDHHTIAAGVGHLTISGKQPTVTRTDNQTISPGAGHLALSGKQPTVSQTAGTTVSPGAGHLTISGKQPTVTRTDNQTVSPGSGHITASGKQPTVTQTGPIIVAPSTGHLTFSGHQPTITQIFGGDVPNTPQDTWDRDLQALFEPFYGDFGESAVVAGIPVVGMFSSRAQDSFGIVQPSAAVLRMSATHVAAVGDTVTVGARTYQIAAIHDLDGSGTEKTLELK